MHIMYMMYTKLCETPPTFARTKTLRDKMEKLKKLDQDE